MDAQSPEYEVGTSTLEFGNQTLPIGIIDINDRGTAQRKVLMKQPCFRSPIGVHISMVIKVIWSEVQEASYREWDAINPLFLKTDGAYLHHRNVDACIHHPTECSMKNGGFWGRKFSGMNRSGDSVVNRSNQTFNNVSSHGSPQPTWPRCSCHWSVTPTIVR